MIGPIPLDSPLTQRARKRAARSQRKPSSRRRSLRIEQLEDRVTPSVNPAAPLELDGNVTTQTSHDWDQVFADNNVTPPPVSGAVASSFVTDAVNSNTDDIFQGGGSKDVLGIQSGKWLFTGSKPQGKDDITHAYAAAYTDSIGHMILYAGLDRFDDSGDATAGFWFFQNNVTENPTVTQNGGHPFTGTHHDGDILLVSDFTTGGSVSTIKVFRWTGNDATGSLVALNNGNPIGGNTFAIVNSAPISVPWSYTNKSGANQPAAGEFLEEGVDLTALGLSGCFSTFLAETRSSQSPTATLSDFVIGSFPLCSVMATPFMGLSKVGDSVTYQLTVKNTGAQPLFLRNVSDTLLGNIVVNGVVQSPVGPVTSIDASQLAANTPLAPNHSLTIFVTRTVQANDPDPTLNTVTFVFNDKADFSGDVVSTSVDDRVELFQPSATMTETASPTTATHLGQPIDYTFTVTNTSSADSPALVLDTSNPNNFFTDTLLGDLEDDAILAITGDPTATVATLAPGASVTFTVTRDIMAGDPTPLTDTSNVAFTLVQSPKFMGSNVIQASASASVTLVPHLTITKVVTPGTPDTIQPGDTASFTITVSNDGAGAATNVSVTDQLPAAGLLTWVVASSTFDTSSIDTSGLLTATDTSLAAGATTTITVSAMVPLDIFGTPPGQGNGDPLPTNLLELDGNAITQTTHDWDQVFADQQTNPPGTSSGAIASSFVTDAVSSRSDDIFQGGGSKDTLGVQQGPWLFTDSKPQAKDDITHAYAALYTDPNTGDSILYAGLDRFDNSGDATAGFWFFVNPIGESTSVSGNGTGPFTGTHSDGDILLVSDFTVGGSVSTIKVFRWTGDDATGSLVPVTTIPNSTFAIVNGAPITVPWSFHDKSHNSGPAAGEFLEEGVNLSALGLNPCFSNFLAETRSSQSPTASLSDFVIGSFNTCKLELPNTATVSADGIPPITTDPVVVITVVEGPMPQLPTALGNGAGTAVLTDQELRAAVAQAIDQWRAAGVDPQRLSALEQVPFHIGDLSRGWLGLTSGNEIWIDRTAAGWGWSTDATPEAGRMDLLTVVTHEFGHILGMAPTATGVMETTLAPGVRQVPEAVSAPSTVTVFVSRAADAGAASSPAALPAVSSTAAVDAVFAAATRGVTPTVAAGQAGVALTLVPQAAAVSPTVATPPAVIIGGPNREAPDAAVPGVRPPLPRVDGGGDAGRPDDETPGAEPTSYAVPAANSSFWQRASDACFAGGSWMDDRADTSGILSGDAAPDAVPAAALALTLGGWWGARSAETEARKRQRFLI